MGQCCLRDPGDRGSEQLVVQPPSKDYAKLKLNALWNDAGAAVAVPVKNAVETVGVESRPLILPLQNAFSSHQHYKFRDCYDIEHLLGNGSFCQVWQTLSTDSGAGPPGTALVNKSRRVAAKCYLLANRPAAEGLPGPSKESTQERDPRKLKVAFQREKVLLGRVQHPHIVKMYESFEDSEHLWIILELAAGGELYSRLAKQFTASGSRRGFEEDVASMYFKQMLSAMAYLHGQRIVHRDVKCENFILMGAEGTPDGDFLKLCDFGAATLLSELRPRAMERIGTLSYTAPEVYAYRGARVCADCWSLGAVVYVMLLAASPFRHSDENSNIVVARIRKGEFIMSRPCWSQLSEAVRGLISGLLQVEEGNRLTTSAALRHEWLRPGAVVKDAEGPVTLLLDSTSSHGLSLGQSPLGFLPPASSARWGRRLVELILQFAKMDPFQRLLLALCARTGDSNILAQRRSKESVPWYHLFFALDADEDGLLALPELMSGLRLFLGPDAHLCPKESILQLLDLDGNGYVQWGDWEALSLLCDTDLPERWGPLQHTFRLLDAVTGDGYITEPDLLQIVGSHQRSPKEVSAQGVQVLQILSRWAPPTMSKPSLNLDSVRRAVTSVQLPSALNEVHLVLDNLLETPSSD
ncbi:unnamed protein product [Polarella glacialis]|uniref:Protein kinase domain-containing protein n=1 Tax=Polarella glacialis TaxID=89957 RepID=A0A813G1E8_POLGL|nr:unnamed protein product [Polarella glacialis]